MEKKIKTFKYSKEGVAAVESTNDPLTGEVISPEDDLVGGEEESKNASSKKKPPVGENLWPLLYLQSHYHGLLNRIRSNKSTKRSSKVIEIISLLQKITRYDHRKAIGNNSIGINDWLFNGRATENYLSCATIAEQKNLEVLERYRIRLKKWQLKVAQLEAEELKLEDDEDDIERKNDEDNKREGERTVLVNIGGTSSSATQGRVPATTKKSLSAKKNVGKPTTSNKKKRPRGMPLLPKREHQSGICGHTCFRLLPYFRYEEFFNYDPMHAVGGVVKRIIEILKGDTIKITKGVVDFCEMVEIFPTVASGKEAPWVLPDYDQLRWEVLLTTVFGSTSAKANLRTPGIFTETSSVKFMQLIKIFLVFFPMLAVLSTMPIEYKYYYAIFSDVMCKIFQTKVFVADVESLRFELLNALMLGDILHMSKECIFMRHELLHLVGPQVYFGPIRNCSTWIGESAIGVVKNMAPEGGPNIMKTLSRRVGEYEATPV